MRQNSITSTKALYPDDYVVFWVRYGERGLAFSHCLQAYVLFFCSVRLLSCSLNSVATTLSSKTMEHQY